MLNMVCQLGSHRLVWPTPRGDGVAKSSFDGNEQSAETAEHVIDAAGFFLDMESPRLASSVARARQPRFGCGAEVIGLGGYDVIEHVGEGGADVFRYHRNGCRKHK